MKILTKLVNWWYDQDYNIDTRHLSLFRIFFCLYTIFIIGVPNYLWINTNHAIPFFTPKLSLGIFFTDLPPPFFFITITVLINLLFGFLLFGFFTRPVAISLSVLMLVGHTFKYSFGKIDHDIFFVLLPLLLSNSGWGNYFSLDKIRYPEIIKRNFFSVRYIALFFAYAMFIAGFTKYLGGWLNLDSKAVFYHVFQCQTLVDTPPPASSFVMKYFNNNYSEFVDYVIVFFEIGFLLAVAKLSIFRIFILLTLIFHFINFITLGIGFIGNVPLYILFIRWQKIIDLSTINKLNFSIGSLITFPNFFIMILILLVQFFVIYGVNFSPILMKVSTLKLLFIYFGKAYSFKWIALPILLTIILFSPKLYLNQLEFKKNTKLS